jgi:hypothetical protein
MAARWHAGPMLSSSFDYLDYRINREEGCMSLVPILWIVWAIIAVITCLLYAYRSALTRDEEGQIFLDDAFAHEKAVQTEIVAKVNRLEPAIRLCLALTVLMTLAVAGYYVWTMAHSLFG